MVRAETAAASVPAAASQPAGPDNDTCLGCHAEAGIEPISARGKTLKDKLRVDASKFKGTPHESLNCTDCHGGAKSFEDVPHNDGKPLTLLCSNCHAGEAEQYGHSVHGGFRAMGDEEAANCGDCHGNHDILPPADRRSSVNKFNLSTTCGKCHQGGAMLKTHNVGDPLAVTHFVDSIHGRALLIKGLAVAPTCNDCHGVHDILPHQNQNSRISKENLPKTCGRCHVLVEETYDKSVHGKLLLAGDKRAPTCRDCHSSHEIAAPRRPEFKLSIDHKCGACHQDRLARYRETFHGKAIALGRSGVAACYDCHGHHDILPSSDPNSRVGPKHRLETCKQCHADANANFANYVVHADHTDRKGTPQVYWVYVFMTLLLLGTFLFFAVHTLLWGVRSFVLYVRDSKTFRDQKVRARNDDEEYVRFNPLERFLHGLVISSFLLLVLTGMPLKFYDTPWAGWMFDHLGGQAVAAMLHRAGAIITIFYFVVHVLATAASIWRGRAMFRDPASGRYTLRQFIAVFFGPDSPMPNLQDFRDWWAHNKWFFGRGEKPQFDRWTYWEKFDYMAVFWGVAIIGLSGLIMWIPETFTRVLPGWIINVALVVHSDEALLAAGFIFTFHFFNVHFRLEKFPMDPVIFSGRISRTELAHERGKLLARWQKEGKLEDKKVKDEWRSWRWIMLPAGFTAFVIGLGLVVLIYAAMFRRLLGH